MWLYKGVGFDPTIIDQENYVGFVYRITNHSNGKKYLGKKLFTKAKTRQVKGKKKRSRVPSDWETYYGSNEELLKDVQLLGEDNFTREILYLCKSKGDCSYWEAFEIFTQHAIPSDAYYNVWMSVRVRKSHLKNIGDFIHDCAVGDLPAVRGRDAGEPLQGKKVGRQSHRKR